MSQAISRPAAGEPLLRLRGVTVVRSLPAVVGSTDSANAATEPSGVEPGSDQSAATVRILDRIDLTISAGEHTVILGPNGSGKTSLLKLLMRHFYPSVDNGQMGEVEIWGRTRWHIDELRKRLGIVSGDLDREFALPRSGRMTGLQAVLSGFDGVQLISFTEQHDPRRRQAALAALERVGATMLVDRPLLTMSTGERRRVLIARALVHHPGALVLDEPTTGLDVVAAAGFLATLRELAATGITLILVTHHIEEIVPEIRRAILIRDGRIFADGACDELLTREKLGRLFGGPLDVVRDETGRYRFC